MHTLPNFNVMALTDIQEFPAWFSLRFPQHQVTDMAAKDRVIQGTFIVKFGNGDLDWNNCYVFGRVEKGMNLI